MPTTNQASVSIPIAWSQDHPRAKPANVFIVHRSLHDEIVLFFGHVAPLLHGSKEEQIIQAQDLASDSLKVEADPVVVLPLKAARQLSAALIEQLQGR